MDIGKGKVVSCRSLKLKDFSKPKHYCSAQMIVWGYSSSRNIEAEGSFTHMITT